MSEWRFELLDRVQRPVDVFNESSRIRHGTVTARYSRYGTPYGDYLELYAVQWDDGEKGRDYLPHGLQPSPRRGDEHPTPLVSGQPGDTKTSTDASTHPTSGREGVTP